MAFYEEANRALQQLTQKYVAKICSIWEQLFEPEFCNYNLRKFLVHADDFYRDLVEDSLSHKELIEREIDELKKEAENLKRLLTIDVNLPSCETEGVPLLVIQRELDKSLENCRELLRQRKQEICELLLQQEALCEELGESPRELLADPLPTSEELKDFKKYLNDLKIVKDDRMNKLVTLRREIKNFLEILEEKITLEFEDRLLNHRQIKLSTETFKALNEMHAKYGNQVQLLKEGVDVLCDKLDTMWDRLDVSPGTRQKFNRYPKYNRNTYLAMYNELERCEELKKQNTKQFVLKIRDEINELWDKCLKSEEEKEHFPTYASNTYTDELLMLHEYELKDLKRHYTKYKPIYDLYADRNVLWERMCALEAKATDPGRYNNRGGQLLKEEKERKIIATKLPKIEQQIGDLVREYEENEQRPFLVYGKNIIDVLADQWEQKRRDKEQVQTARKKAISSPNPLRHASSMMSLRKTPSTTSLSTRPATCMKRKLKPTDTHTPNAKRSLLLALNSPSVNLKPSTSKNCVKPSPALSLANKSPKLKSSLKKPKPVIGSTLRRRSGRQSCSGKKRKSINKNNSGTKVIPRILVEDCATSDGYTTEDTYDSFQKCIEPASRSSIRPDLHSHSENNIRGCIQQELADERERIARLPRPPRIKTPSRPNPYASTSRLARSVIQNNSHSQITMAASTGRKLTTKNLPIII